MITVLICRLFGHKEVVLTESGGFVCPRCHRDQPDPPGFTRGDFIG